MSIGGLYHKRTTENIFRAKLEAGEFVVTGEVAPPRGVNCSSLLKAVETFSPVADAINITDNQGATLHLSSLAASRMVLEAGLEPIFQQTCRDRNRLALQSDLLAAWTLGLENFLAVTGDSPHSGDHPQSKGVFDIDSTQLLRVASALNNGTDMNGKLLDGESTDFFIGAAAFPEAEPWAIQKRRIAQKIEAGAQFFQTQAIMDVDVFAPRIAEIQEMGAKVIVGVLLLKSPSVIRFINTKLAGLMVPDHLAEKIIAADDPFAESVALAVEQAKVVAEIADGIHIMPLGANEAAVEILKQAHIR